MTSNDLELHLNLVLGVIKLEMHSVILIIIQIPDQEPDQSRKSLVPSFLAPAAIHRENFIEVSPHIPELSPVQRRTEMIEERVVGNGMCIQEVS